MHFSFFVEGGKRPFFVIVLSGWAKEFRTKRWTFFQDGLYFHPEQLVIRAAQSVSHVFDVDSYIPR